MNVSVRLQRLFRSIVLSAVSLLFSCVCSSAEEESLAITTFFPPPAVTYRTMRLMPQDSDPGLCDSSRRGTMYYYVNGSDELVKVCNGTQWSVVGGSGVDAYWKKNETLGVLYPDSPASPAWSVVLGQREAAIYNESSGLMEPPAGPIFQVNGSISRSGGWVAGNISSQVNLGSFASQTDATGSTVAGGAANQANRDWATVGGGKENHAQALYAATAGGYNTYARANYSFVGGGEDNTIEPGSEYSVILGGGGTGNLIDNPSRGYAVVAGGYGNQIYNSTMGCSLITGGYLNQVLGCHDSVLNGQENIIAFNDGMVTGQNCYVDYGGFAGGLYSNAHVDYSFAFGNHAKAFHSLSFVFADGSSNNDFPSNKTSSFNIRASGGINFIGPVPPIPVGPGVEPWNASVVFDVAEFMSAPRSSSVQAGDLVSINRRAMVDRSRKADDRQLIGVVSGKRTCSFFMGTPEGTGSVKRVPVSLSGPVYCRVSNESGPVALGDPITSSSTPGVGMKAKDTCRIVGFAMKDEQFRDAGVKELPVFVSVGFYCPKKKLQDMEAELAFLENEVSELEKK